MSEFVERSNNQASVDTITIAGLMNAVHSLHRELLRSPEAGTRLAAIEAAAIKSIKQIDAGDFDYQTQAAGIGETLKLVKANVPIFACHRQPEGDRLKRPVRACANDEPVELPAYGCGSLDYRSPQ